MGFDRLKAQKVTEAATRDFKLEGVIDFTDANGAIVSPTLVVRHAGPSNAAFWSTVLRQANEKRGAAGIARVTPASIVEARANDAKLYAQFVVVDWRNVFEDGATSPTPFSVDKCEELLLAVAASMPDVFDVLRAFVSDADNFRTVAAVDGAALGKR